MIRLKALSDLGKRKGCGENTDQPQHRNNDPADRDPTDRNRTNEEATWKEASDASIAVGSRPDTVTKQGLLWGRKALCENGTCGERSAGLRQDRRELPGAIESDSTSHAGNIGNRCALLKNGSDTRELGVATGEAGNDISSQVAWDGWSNSTSIWVIELGHANPIGRLPSLS